MLSPDALFPFPLYGIDYVKIRTVFSSTGTKQLNLLHNLKHFAVNESEIHCNGICTWLTEQMLRELYLKSFEIAIKRSDDSAHALMSSFNRIGSSWTGGDWRLITHVLHEEFPCMSRRTPMP